MAIVKENVYDMNVIIKYYKKFAPSSNSNRPPSTNFVWLNLANVEKALKTNIQL